MVESVRLNNNKQDKSPDQPPPPATYMAFAGLQTRDHKDSGQRYVIRE